MTTYMERFEKENIKEHSKKKWGDDGQAFPWFDEKYQFHICIFPGEEEGVQGYKYTCEPGDVDWTPMNSNLHMQSIKVF